MQYCRPTVQQLAHILNYITCRLYKIFVIEREGFGDEFFILLTRPEIMTMTECSDAIYVRH